MEKPISDLKVFGVEYAARKILKDNEITRDVLSDLNEKNLQSNLPLGPRIKLVKSLSESNTAPLENIQTDKSSQSSSSFSAKVNDQRVNIKEVLKNDLPLIYSNKLIPQKDVTSADVSQIVRSLTKKLAQATDYYPTATEKENLAKDLVELFPESFKKYSLFCKEGAEKPPSYALFYWKNGPQNRSTGKIENALQTLRRQLPLESKKQTKRSAQRLTKFKMSAEKEASLLHINELKANAENKIKIMETMDSLYKYRRQMIQQKCSISELLAAYPQITEYGGEVIRNDFAKQFPAAKSFKNFLNYVGIINTMVNKWDEVQNHTIRAILNIFSFLANRGLQKRIDETSVLTQKEQEISDLIVYIQPGTDMHGYIQKKKSNFPYIICRGTSKFKEGNYYIIMGDKYIFMEYDAHLSFDVMFQLYHIMELKYPPFFKKTFEFMGSFIYQCEKSSSQCIQNLIRRLERNTSVNTDNEDDEQDEDDGSDSDSD